MWPSDPSGLLSEEKQKELRTLSSQATACEEKTLWSQIKEESQEVTNTSSEKKTECWKGPFKQDGGKSKATMPNTPV